MKTEHRQLGLLGLILCTAVSLGACTSTAPGTALESLAALETQAPSARQLDIQQWQTAEGARVLFVQASELPMFDLRLTFAAGSSHDGAVPGLASLTNAMLNEGVPGKDVSQIAADFENLGADFSAGAYRDMAVASLRSLSDPALSKPALSLFSEVIGRPTFPDDALARLKNQLLAGFEYQKQDPGTQANLKVFERLYGNHPYAHPSSGDERSVPGITSAQLKAFHARAYTAPNAVIALVGDLTRERAEAIAAQISAALPKGPALPKIPQPATPKAGLSHIEFASNQTHLVLAQLGIDRSSPDQPALALGNQIFGGGGFGARLMHEVRERRGLTYGVYSGFSPMQVRGPFMISLQTRADYSEGTLALIKDLLRDYLREGPTAKEVDDAKREMAGSFPLSTASNADIVGQLAVMGFYDLPLTYLDDYMRKIQALTVEDVKAAWARHLNPDDLVVVTVGPNVTQTPLPAPTNPTTQPVSGAPH